MATFGEIFNATYDSASATIRTVGRASKSQTLSASNTTAATAIFSITGTVEIKAIWGVVTTDLGANHTTAFWRLNDQTSQIALTLATGTTLSAIKAGSTIVKKGLVGAALVKIDNAAGAVSEPTTLETDIFSPILVVKKTGAATNIEYVYSTTDAPTTGVIQHFVDYIPRSSDGAVTALQEYLWQIK